MDQQQRDVVIGCVADVPGQLGAELVDQVLWPVREPYRVAVRQSEELPGPAARLGGPIGVEEHLVTGRQRDGYRDARLVRQIAEAEWRAGRAAHEPGPGRS